MAVYIDADGDKTSYVLPFIVFSSLAHLTFKKANNLLLKYYRPYTDYKKELQPSFFSFTRFFGSAGLLLAVIPFEYEIDILLWKQLLIGSTFSIIGYSYRIRKVFYADKGLIYR